MTRRAIVVGAGISGLAAAHRLQAAGVETILVEAGSRSGGCIATSRRDGFLLEEGPDAFLTTKRAAVQLAEELGLADQLVATNPDHRRSFILRAGGLVPVPEGFYLLAPSSIAALLKTPLFSWHGKLRMAMEPFIPAGQKEDETLAGFVRRRLGREALSRFAQPMVGGIYTADPEKLSLRATFPQFLDMEREQGSVLKGLRDLPRGTSGARYGFFASFREGMQGLVDALTARLTIRTGIRVERLERSGDAWKLSCSGGEILEAEALCLALPAWASARLLPGLGLEGIPYADCATLNLAFRRDQVAHPLDGMGFVVPHAEGMNLLSCSFSSVKFPGRAPEGQVLLRAFAGGALQPDRYALPDGALTAAVLEDLRRILGISGEPLFTVLRRHPQAMPQYHLGHLERLAGIETEAAKLPGLALAGNFARGAGIPDCIASGEAAAKQLLASAP